MFRMPNDKNMVVFGRDVRNAKSDYDPQSGPDVTMGFSCTGTKAFKAITSALAERGRLTQNTEVPFAVILDNKIEATPTISYQRTPDGIDGNAQITGLTTGEANRIALVLQSGSLPVTFNTLSQSQVSATLGKDSLNQALIAGLLGLLVVMIYLAFFYRLLGLVADLALLVYAALLLRADPADTHHDDPAGHRGHDPDDRRGGRCERRHLRAHQGRGAPRQERARGDLIGLHEGLPHDRRRQRRDADHRRRAVHGRHRQRQGLRLHARRRRARLDVHGRARDARHARRALGLQAGSTTPR